MLSSPAASLEVESSQSEVSWLSDLLHSSVLSEELSHDYSMGSTFYDVFSHSFLLCLR